MEALAVTARKFHQRPSALLDIRDPLLALNFDLAAAAVLNRLDREAFEDAQF